MKLFSFIIFIIILLMNMSVVRAQSTGSNNQANLKDTVQQNTAKPIIGTLDLFLPAPVVFGQDRDEFEISQRIMNKKEYFLQCYTSNLSKFDPLTFRIRFEITVQTSGEVQSVNVLMKGTKNQVMINCFKSIFRQIRFGPVNGIKPTIIEQSLIFRVI